MEREIETYCPCGNPIFKDEKVLTGFCEDCSKEK